MGTQSVGQVMKRRMAISLTRAQASALLDAIMRGEAEIECVTDDLYTAAFLGDLQDAIKSFKDGVKDAGWYDGQGNLAEPKHHMRKQ